MNPDDTQQNTNSQDPQTQDPSGTGGDNMFPSFLNNTNTDGFDPSQMSTLSGDGSEEGGEEQKVVASPGSPEAGGGVMVESSAETPEYSSEVQTSAESPEIESVESKDAMKPQVSADEPGKPKVEEKPVEDEDAPNSPKIFGYMVPPAVMSDFKKIRTDKTTGSTDSAKTWLYVLLDRLLKVHSKKG